MNIAIISSSVRIGRKSHRVAMFLKNYITNNNLAAVEILDLHEYNFPIFEERLQYLKDPLPSLVQYAEKIKSADGIIIVTPEYNGGYPASLKNAIDVLYPEWKRKPVAIATASDGPFGGAQVNTSLAFSLWKIGVMLVPAMYLGPKVHEIYGEDGTPVDKALTEKRVKPFINELLWCMEARKRMA
jgi:NAD(P)H-dependent FMN reductase